MLKRMTKEKGITTIGLVVTIIVMIILAGVTISVMKGDSGIISKADESKNSSKRSELIERAKIKVSDKVVNKGGTLLTKDELREILENYFIEVPANYKTDTDLITKSEYGNYTIKVSEIYDREFWGDDEETPDNPVTPPEPTPTSPTNPTTQPTTPDTGGEDTSGSKEIDVEGIEIDKKAVVLDISKENTVQLNAKVKPANANKNTKVIWESEDNNIASVNENGLVTGKEVGKTNIIATTENGVYDDECSVICQSKITGITVSPTTANIQVGQKIQLTAVTTPETVTEKMTWKSRNEEVATVDESGNVTGIRNGTVEIIAQNPSATIKAVCLINVQTEPVEVRLNYSVLVIDINSTDIPKLEAMVIPNTANVNANITWKSSDPSIVEVDGGNVIPIKNGNAVITARTDNGIEATCDIIVQTSPLGVTLNKNKITLDMSGTKTAKLIATINPYTANVNKDITWTSSNTDIAEVEDGLVTGISNGTAVITAMTANGKHAECIVEVQTSPTEVKLNYSSLILEKSALASPTLKATILPESANVNTNITWSSSNTSVVAVDNGKLAIKGNGSTTITVKTDNGCRSQCTIVIRTSITSIEVSPTSKKMEVNQTAQLTATVNPADTTEKVQWTSSNTDVATVNDTGLVTAKATGTVTITVKNANGTKSATCVVDVTKQVSTSESYVGYYADIEGDGTVDGIIFEDFAIGGSGTWAGYSYSVSKVSNTQEYYISQVGYDGNFGKKDVISLKNSSSGNKRFYVMALKDATTQTVSMSSWNNYQKGEWIVLDKSGWAAFAAAISINASNYEKYGLSPYYWTSSGSINSDLWYWIDFRGRGEITDTGKTKWEVVDDRNYVRLAKQF